MIPLSALSRSLLLYAVVTCAAGAATTTTPPSGAIQLLLKGADQTTISLPLFDLSHYSGPISGVASNTISFVGSPLVPGQFVSPSSPFLVQVLSGAQKGRSLIITANTANSVTVQTGDTSLTEAGFAIAVPDRVEIFRAETLASIFGGTTAGLVLKGGISITSADIVQMVEGGVTNSYYFNTTSNFWVRYNGNGSNQNNLIVLPESGLMVVRRGASLPFVIAGRAPSTGLLSKLTSGKMIGLASRFPVDTTLADLQLSAPGVWIKSDTQSSADSVQIYDNGWRTYWQRLDGDWREVSSGSASQNSRVIPAGSSVSVLKKGTATGGAKTFYYQEIPQ